MVVIIRANQQIYKIPITSSIIKLPITSSIIKLSSINIAMIINFQLHFHSFVSLNTAVLISEIAHDTTVLISDKRTAIRIDLKPCKVDLITRHMGTQGVSHGYLSRAHT